MNTSPSIHPLLVSLALLAGCNTNGATRTTSSPETPPPTTTIEAPTPPAASAQTDHCNPTTQGDCVAGTPGGQCSDALYRQVCVEGTWKCPDNTIPTSQCGCLGKPLPGCTCDGGGWKCAEGATPK